VECGYSTVKVKRVAAQFVRMINSADGQINIVVTCKWVFEVIDTWSFIHQKKNRPIYHHFSR